MTNPERAAEAAIRLLAGPMEITFVKAGDRWRHVVAVAGAMLLESVEGAGAPAATDRWPASPALTEVTLVDAGGRPAVLGLGLAGRSHFSVSVTVHPERADALLFDVACRIQERPAWLGSTYRAADGSLVQAAPPAAGADLPRTVQWAYGVGPAGLVPPPAAARQRSP
jgi:hypothetical protein